MPTLERWFEDYGLETNRYARLEPEAKPAFRELFLAVFAADASPASPERGKLEALARKVGYRVDPHDVGLLLADEHRARRGQAALVLRADVTERWLIEVPHPVDDRGALAFALGLFASAQARALVAAGSKRCAHHERTSCNSGRTSLCTDKANRARPAAERTLLPYPISDVAHDTSNALHWSHEVAHDLGWITLSLHTFRRRARGPDIVVSNGTCYPAPPRALGQRLRAALARPGVTVQLCNEDATRAAARRTSLALCGKNNVQGRYSNGRADPCAGEASHASDRFLHVEVARDFATAEHVQHVAAALVAALHEP